MLTTSVDNISSSSSPAGQHTVAISVVTLCENSLWTGMN